jgi:hypothetical protein
MLKMDLIFTIRKNVAYENIIFLENYFIFYFFLFKFIVLMQPQAMKDQPPIFNRYQNPFGHTSGASEIILTVIELKVAYCGTFSG